MLWHCWAAVWGSWLLGDSGGGCQGWELAQVERPRLLLLPRRSRGLATLASPARLFYKGRRGGCTAAAGRRVVCVGVAAAPPAAAAAGRRLVAGILLHAQCSSGGIPVSRRWCRAAHRCRTANQTRVECEPCTFFSDGKLTGRGTASLAPALVRCRCRQGGRHRQSAFSPAGRHARWWNTPISGVVPPNTILGAPWEPLETQSRSSEAVRPGPHTYCRAAGTSCHAHAVQAARCPEAATKRARQAGPATSSPVPPSAAEAA